MEKSKEELIEYAITMRERGDSYMAMLNYLNLNCNDEAVRNEVIGLVSIKEKAGAVKIKDKRKKQVPKRDIVLGFLSIAFGLALMSFLWGKGFIATLPFILIGFGFIAIIGNLSSFR